MMKKSPGVSGRQHLPYARAARLFSDWLGAPLSTGTLAAFMGRGGEDLGAVPGCACTLRSSRRRSPISTRPALASQGKLRWLFCSSTEQATFYSLHDRRGFDGLDHAGVLPNFSGVAVHDGFKPYRNYTNVEHALCNVHHLRELLGLIEQAPDDPKQEWAVRMDAFLRELHATVEQARACGRDQSRFCSRTRQQLEA